jgi:hypothetical protein
VGLLFALLPRLLTLVNMDDIKESTAASAMEESALAFSGEKVRAWKQSWHKSYSQGRQPCIKLPA